MCLNKKMKPEETFIVHHTECLREVNRKKFYHKSPSGDDHKVYRESQVEKVRNTLATERKENWYHIPYHHLNISSD